MLRVATCVEMCWDRKSEAIWKDSECSEEILTAASVPCARYRTIAEALEDPLFAERGALQTVSDPAGDYLVTNLPFKMSCAETAAMPTVSKVGEYKLSDFL